MNNLKMQTRWFFILGLAIFFVAPFQAQSKVWKNAYISFEIPDRWKCVLEQTEWVCRSEDPNEAKEAIIILTAKETGVIDTYNLYEEHLAKPIAANLRGGGTALSQVYRKPETMMIQGEKWIDGFHLGSEVQQYFTRYLGTIRTKISVLVTFSAHKDVYAKYSADFMKAVQSLKVIADKDIIATRENGISGSGSDLFGQSQVILPPEGPIKPQKKDKSLFIALGAILAALGIYIFIRMKKKK